MLMQLIIGDVIMGANFQDAEMTEIVEDLKTLYINEMYGFGIRAIK